MLESNLNDKLRWFPVHQYGVRYRHFLLLVSVRDANFIKRHMLSEEDYLCKVDWAALTIEHRLVKFEPKQEEGTEIETNWGKVVTGE